jgi:hypothetical protein
MTTTAAPVAIDPGSFEEPVLQALTVLLIHKQDTQWMTAAEISKELRDQHGIGLHWKKIESAFEDNPSAVARRKASKQWQFRILRAGEELLGAAQSTILFIDPTQAVKATMSLHDFFYKLKGTVRVCDAYLDNTTLEHLHALDKSVTVQLLTKNVKDSGPLRRIVAAWKSEGRTLEIRVDGTAPLHDRYIIDDSIMTILGTSLNGFGKKQCFIIQTGPDLRAVVLPVFDGLWKSAAVWP